MVEQLFRKQQVVGSNPTVGSIILYLKSPISRAQSGGKFSRQCSKPCSNPNGYRWMSAVGNSPEDRFQRLNRLPLYAR